MAKTWEYACGREFYKFGFSSIQQLRQWFYDDWWLQELSLNFKLYELVVPNDYVIQGHTQVAFDSRYSDTIYEADIINFFSLEKP